jgi:hypothetical protein
VSAVSALNAGLRRLDAGGRREAAYVIDPEEN